MKQPGVWVFGSTEDDMRAWVWGVVIEYAGQHGKPQWSKPQSSTWDYTVFGTTTAILNLTTLHLVFEKSPAVTAASIVGRSMASPGRMSIRWW